MKTAKLVDVAKIAGVSTSMVSLVLSGKGANRCSEETEARIRAAAQEIGYRANRLARSLKEQQTRTLGLLSIEVATTPYAGEMLMAAQRTARAHDYDLFFVEVENNPKSIEEALDLMAEHQVSGVLIAAFFHCEIKMPANTPKNLVFANCYGSDGTFPTYIPDEYGSFMQCLDLVGQAGHERVGLIVEEYPWPAAIGRTEAFMDAASRFGWVDPKDHILAFNDTNSNDGYLGALEMMKNDPEVTAIVCYNDRIAMGAYQALHELGISIPDQVSIVGFDDLELISGGLRPGLTTVRLPHYQMGKQAVDQLIRICEDRDEEKNQIVEIRGELVIRDSLSFRGSPTNSPVIPNFSTPIQ
jgi:LacI family transcriptional regulator